MNFFEHQDRARRSTTRLVVLFTLAVVLILVAMNSAAYGVMRLVSPHLTYAEDAAPVFRGDLEYPGRLAEIEPLWQRPSVYVIVSACTLLVIAGGSLYKTASLSRGGPAVAEMLGGRPVPPNTHDPRERTLLNVVEEMAIASGVPVPAVYLLDGETGINAFAAGFSARDAVVAVTRGCVERLSRDELQGVVAHEFSHILNADVRLNLRLIGIVHGILVIALIGYLAIRSIAHVRVRGGDKDGKGAAGLIVVVLVAGAAMVVIGYVGMFFARLIHAAVSRRREFLADASAVQFTRNPAGIAGALKKIGRSALGSQVGDEHAMEVAHMFFAQGIAVGFARLLATHPPLEERIRAIDPTFDGSLGSTDATGRSARGLAGMGGGAAAGFSQAASDGFIGPNAAAVLDRVGSPAPQDVTFAHHLLGAIPEVLLDAAHDPFSARALVFCLLAGEKGGDRPAQLEALRRAVDEATYRETIRLLPEVDALGPAGRLPMLDLALPGLRQQSGPQVRQFKDLCKRLIEADRRVSRFEYVLHKIVERYLRSPGESVQPRAVSYYSVKGVEREAAALLAVLASAGGHRDPDAAAAAFAAGLRRAGLSGQPMPKASLSELDRALSHLAVAAPGVKRRLIDGLAHAAAADRTIGVEEAELLRAIATTLDCPLPPLLAGAGASSAEMTADATLR